MVPTIAAFDFDGTLTYRDTLLPFFNFVKGPLATSLNLAKGIPFFAEFLLKRLSRQEVKEIMLASFFKGMKEEELQLFGKKFAETKIDSLLRPEGMQRLRWHQAQGHRCILISASIETYLGYWADRVGFQDLLCSKLETDAEMCVTGKLNGTNCWGPEKRRRLLQLLGPKINYELYAYGDSSGDRELLELADRPYYRRFSNTA
jgi:HAD superfamily hydrolase (TIGR01490 family)